MFADQMLIRICLIIGSLLAAIFVLRRVRQAKCLWYDSAKD